MVKKLVKDLVGIAEVAVDCCEQIVDRLCPPIIHVLKPKPPLWLCLKIRSLGDNEGWMRWLRWGLKSNRLTVFIRRGREARTLSLFPMQGQSKMAAISKSEEKELSPEHDRACTLISEFQLPHLLENKFCCLSHLVYGIFMAFWANTFIIIKCN